MQSVMNRQTENRKTKSYNVKIYVIFFSHTRYDDVNGICCCTVNGLPYEAPPATNKKLAKQLAAKCAVEHILENAQLVGMY